MEVYRYCTLLLTLGSAWGAEKLAPPLPWPSFRGPNSGGVAEASGLPDRLDRAVWKTALPGGHSSPVLTGRQVFVTAFEGDALLTIALERTSGRVEWRREAPRAQVTKIRARNTPASASPATDGERVYVYFEDAGLLAYGVDGALQWHVKLDKPNTPYGPAASPVVVDDAVLLAVDQDTGSYLLSVGRRDGKVRWKTPRPEATHGFATPVVYRPAKGNAQVIVSGSYQLIAYDAGTGAKLWWVDGMAWQAKSTPVLDGDRLYVHSWMASPGELGLPSMLPEWPKALEEKDANHDGKISADEMGDAELKRVWFLFDLNKDNVLDEHEWNVYRARGAAKNGLYAIPLGGMGDLTPKVLWRFDRSLPNIPSPVLYRDVMYLLKEGGVLTSLDPRTGAVLKQGRLEGALEPYFASPVAADGKLYAVSMNGKATVIRAAAQWEILSSADLKDEVWATPALADDRVYVRTAGALYCFGKAS